MIPEPASLLEVNDLHVGLSRGADTVYPVDGVSFSIVHDEVLAIVGESGSGKTMTSLSVMGLLPQPQARVMEGSIRWKGQELVGADQETVRLLRGSEMSMIFQDPMTSLNPVMTIGAQLIEAARVHRKLSKSEARDAALDSLTEVGLSDARNRMHSYAHEMSGGMLQRVMIAMALINRPDLLIADEPTTALDVTIQAQILELLLEIQQKNHCAILLITHDLGVVAGIADRVLVMYAGKMAEFGSTDDVFYRSAHPYTKGLLHAVPQISSDANRLRPIPGQPPSLRSIPTGCPFYPRCSYAKVPGVCSEQVPDWVEIGESHFAACHFSSEVMSEVIQP